MRGADGALVPPEHQTYPGAAPEDGLASALHWPAGSNQWLHVEAVVLGEAGRMRCLPPSVRVLQLQQGAAAAPPASAAAAALAVQQLALEEEAQQAEDEEQAEELRTEAAAVAAAAAEAAAPSTAAASSTRLVGAFDLTPPPPTLASPEAVRSARVRLEIVADRLALAGAAQISAYMHAETGELVVADVCTTPDLSPGALAFRAAAADAEAPQSPAELLHELVRVGLMEKDASGSGDGLGGMPFPDMAEVRLTRGCWDWLCSREGPCEGALGASG